MNHLKFNQKIHTIHNRKFTSYLLLSYGQTEIVFSWLQNTLNTKNSSSIHNEIETILTTYNDNARFISPVYCLNAPQLLVLNKWNWSIDEFMFVLVTALSIHRYWTQLVGAIWIPSPISFHQHRIKCRSIRHRLTLARRLHVREAHWFCADHP